MIASLPGDIVAICAAIAILLIGGAACYALFQGGQSLRRTAEMIDGVKDETIPLLGEVRTTVVNVNRELDRTDGILESAGNIARSAERLTAVVEETVSSPLIKMVAFSAGIGKAFRRMVGAD